MLEINNIYCIDALEGLKKIENDSIDSGLSSPPYNKRGLMLGKKPVGGDWSGYITYENYDDNIPEKDYQNMQIDILNEIQRILKPGGSFFYNHKNRRYNKTEFSPNEWIRKCNLNLYQTIIWDKKKDVNNNKYFLQPIYETIYWFTKDNKKSPKFFKKRLKEQKNIWKISSNINLPHPATFPEELAERCILSTTDVGDLVIDPFVGIGTTAVVANRLKRNYIGFDHSKEYVKISIENIKIGKIRKKKEI